MAQRKVLTALAKIEDETPLHMGAAHQILCHLDGVNSLGAHLALFGAQPLTLVAEDAGRASRGCGMSPGPVWTFLIPQG